MQKDNLINKVGAIPDQTASRVVKELPDQTASRVVKESELYTSQNSRGYWELHQHYYDVTGKRQHRFIKHLGKDLAEYESFITDAAELVGILQREPHLLLDVNLKRLVNEAKRQKERLNDKASVARVEPIPVGPFSAIIIDPPWPMEKILRDKMPNQSTFDYPTMEIDEIRALPIRQMAKDWQVKGDCPLSVMGGVDRFVDAHNRKSSLHDERMKLSDFRELS